MAEQLNDASRKSKAEGDGAYQDTDERSGITNRSMDEETSNQQAVPSRGQAKKCGPPGGLGDSDSDMDMETRRSKR